MRRRTGLSGGAFLVCGAFYACVGRESQAYIYLNHSTGRAPISAVLGSEDGLSHRRLIYGMRWSVCGVERSVSGVSQAWQAPCPTFRSSIQTFRRRLGSKTVARAKRHMFCFLTKTSSAASLLWADAEEVVCTSSNSAADLNRPSRTRALHSNREASRMGYSGPVYFLEEGQPAVG